MSPRTEQSYLAWIRRRYARYHSLRHPDSMGDAEVVDFLPYLASEQKVARSTQIQAMGALMLLYKDVLKRPLGDIRAAIRSTAPVRLPVVLTREEVRDVLAQLEGDVHLIVLLLYGSGLRLAECLNLRVKDVDLATGEIRVRRGKGVKDRVTMIPRSARTALEAQLEAVRELHARDLATSRREVAVSRCPALSRAGRRVGRRILDGSGSYRRGVDTSTLRLANRADFIFTKPLSSVRFSGRFAMLRLRNGRVATRCGIHLRRICSRMATIFGRFRSCLGTQMCRRR